MIAASLEQMQQQLVAMELRLQRAEAELAIRNLMVRYGLAADAGDAERAMACHTENALYIVAAAEAGREDSSHSNDLRLQGRAAIGKMLRSDLHQSLLPNCAHTVGPFDVSIQGDAATAFGYSRLYVREGDKLRLMRLGNNEWRFKKVEGQWLIDYRHSAPLGC